MTIKDLTTLAGRRLLSAGSAPSVEKTEDRLATCGWLALSATVLVAMATAVCAAV